MSMSLELFLAVITAIVTVMVGGVTILATIVGGFAWISGKLEKVNKTLAALDKESVTHQVCSEHRKNCPCVEDIRELKKKIDKEKP